MDQNELKQAQKACVSIAQSLEKGSSSPQREAVQHFFRGTESLLQEAIQRSEDDPSITPDRLWE